MGMGPSGLVLKEWAIDFDLSRDPLSLAKVWVILPNLSLVFWDEAVLISIGNKIGKFLSYELDWDTKTNEHWAWVQLEVDLSEGLLDEIELA
jgi:hypothetical protein